MAITDLPTPPDRATPSTFSALADAFIAALPVFVAEANAQAAALELNDTTDTSSSSVAIGTGAKTFTVTAAKSFQPGMWLVIADDAAPSTNAMYGTITSYSTDQLVMDIKTVLGSGTKSAWTISQSSIGGLTSGGPLGTPSSGVLTNATGLPLTTGIVPGAANLKAFTNAAGTALEWANGFFLDTDTRNLTAAGGSVQYTGAGFKPSAVIFVGAVSAAFASIGIAAAAVDFSISQYSTSQWFVDTGYSFGAWINGSNYQRFRVDTWDADGITGTWSKTGSPTGTSTFALFYLR